MKGFRRLALIGLVGLAALLLFPPLSFAQQYKPGANFWGDYDNSLIDGPDVGALAAVLAGMDPGYWILLPTSRARTSKWQDLDGNGNVDGPDLAILKAWAKSDFSDITGNPASLAAENYNPSVDAGDSVVIRARGPSWNAGKWRPGYGIVYKIRNDLGTCPGATIYGRNVLDGKTYGYYADMAYEYTAEPSDGGYAQTRVSAPGNCANDSEIVVEVYIPGDSEFGVYSKRHPARMTAPQYIIITVTGGEIPYVTSVEVLPGSTNIEEGSTISFTALCTLSDASTVDCTESYGGTETQWTGSGHLTQLSPANMFQAGIGNGVGGVEAQYDGGGPILQDGGTVLIWDITPPDTSITSNPPDPSDSPDASFSFICDEIGCGFECNLDYIGWYFCLSPKEYQGLADGIHTFQVRAIDPAFHFDPLPASYSWTIDNPIPDTTITYAPLNPSNTKSAGFEFTCDKASCVYECKMDTGSWAACDTPKDYTGLADGSHTFQVRATYSGNTDPTPASYGWFIDSPPDTFITSTPALISNQCSATFQFNCDEAVCGFECSLDWTYWAPCRSPKNYSGLTEGPHTFVVRASDQNGHFDGVPAIYDWEVDLTPPETNITSQPANPTNSTTATFNFTCTESPCTYQCQLDGGGYSSCTSGKSYSSLTAGSHTFQVYGTDQAGNPDGSPASYTWTIDLTPPDTNITGKPSNPTNATDATFNFTCTESPLTYQCQLDSGGYSSCSPGIYYPVLTEGSHTFQVYCTDQAGNPDASPDSYTWQIDLTEPDTTITSNPTNPSPLSFVQFGFTCSESPATYQCQLDGGGFSACADPKEYPDRWTDTSTTNQPEARQWHTTVWTATEMIVWGGYNGLSYLSTGGRYNPVTDSWTATSDTNAPAGRYWHSSVWTGTKMIVWGGWDGSSYLSTGGVYNSATNSWTATSDTNAPAERYLPTSVWTGTEMIVWGGSGFGFLYLNNGGRYNPATNSWTATTLTNAPQGRDNHSAIWAGTEMIVWGGEIEMSVYANTGGRYNPATDSWTATTLTNAPDVRSKHSAVWTGKEMIIWGGNYLGGYYSNGGRYNPATDSWTATTLTNAPLERNAHTAIWTGTEMIIWGGFRYGELSSGARYNPATNSWTDTPVSNAPDERYMHTAVWTGSQMIVWGGHNSGAHYDTGGILGLAEGSHTFEVRCKDQAGNTDSTPVSYTWSHQDTWTPTSTTSPPAARYHHRSVWTGTEMIVWGGYGSSPTYKNDGGKYNPATDSWTATDTTTAPVGRYWHATVWTGTELIVWGGNAGSHLNSGGKYNPATNSWTATCTTNCPTTNAPSARMYISAVWTGAQMVVWGGYNGSELSTGGKYDPVANSWTDTNTTGAPPATDSYSLVWTGKEMIVWGGYPGINSGGRYNPTANSWILTNTTGAPSARYDHTAVWAGSEMIIWGGNPATTNTGGKYNPASNSWTATSTTNAPSGRYWTSAAWNGTEMLVWGGYGSSPTYKGDGGRYNPSTNSWIATTSNNAPSARYGHSTVWTGNQMIIWGGNTGSYQYTGGRYWP